MSQVSFSLVILLFLSHSWGPGIFGEDRNPMPKASHLLRSGPYPGPWNAFIFSSSEFSLLLYFWFLSTLLSLSLSFKAHTPPSPFGYLHHLINEPGFFTKDREIH